MRNWKVIATAQQGDLFPDQNALNVLCYRDPDRVTILDSRVWNVNGRLLKAVTAADGEIYCEGHKLIFAHATSAYPGDLTGTMPISAKDCGCEAFLRFLQTIISYHFHIRVT